MGGTAPVVGATVTLYEAGTAPGATPAVLASATTDNNGAFSINYTTPALSAVLYILAADGDAGGGANPAIELATAYSAAHPPATATLNELTTVATAYALNGFFAGDGFADSAGHHLALALAPIGNFVDIATGNPGAVIQNAANGTKTTTWAKFNALANALANCVQTVPSAPACQDLMSNATPSGGSAPQNTLQAIVDVARNPTHNVSALLGLAAGGPYTSPAPATSANSLTLALQYTGGGLGYPAGIAVDGAGNVWVADDLPTGLGRVTKLAPDGTPLSPAPLGFSAGVSYGPNGIAVDGVGHVWVANSGTFATPGTSVTELAADGTPLSRATGFTGGGLYGPEGIAVDGSGNVWVSNYPAAAVSKLGGDGSILSPSGGFTGGGLNGPKGIDVDAAGNVWVANSANNSVTELDANGSPVSPFNGFTGGGLDGPRGLVVDDSGHVWVANDLGDSVTELAPDGTALSSSTGFTGGGLNGPAGIAVDGAGNVWVANSNGNSVTELAPDGTALSPSTGFTGGGVTNPTGIAVDGAGNVWVTSGVGAVAEYVGAAAVR